MHNQNIKQQYLLECPVEDEKKTRLFFKKVEQLEEKYQKDLYEFDDEQINSIFSTIFVEKRFFYVFDILFIIKDYCSWCIEQNINSHPAIYRIIKAECEPYRNKMFASPLHLQSFLDEIFDDESKDSIDLIFRAFIWLIYCGISAKDTISITSDDLNFEFFRIKHDGKEYFMHYDAHNTLAKVSTLNEFNFKVEGVNKTFYRKKVRSSGNKILRTNRSDPNYIQIRSNLEKKCSSADKRIYLLYVYLSGLFYNLLELEQAGKQLPWETVVLREMEGKKYSSNYLNTTTAKIKKKLIVEYRIWKTLFLN